MKLFLKISFLILLSFIIWMTSCTKEKLPVENVANPKAIDVRIDEPEYPDSIVSISLEVEVIDGVLSFETHDELINSMNTLSSHNSESIKAWEEAQNFTSLFSEWIRIDELETYQEKLDALNEGRLSQLLEFGADGDLFLVHSDLSLAMVMDIQGLLYVEGFVGTIGNDLNIWTVPSKKHLLLDALNSNTLPQDSDFIIIDGIALGGVNSIEPRVSAADTVVTECPLDKTLFTKSRRLRNPVEYRWVDAIFGFNALITPRSNGNKDYTAKLHTNSTSRKGLFRVRYKTDHYHRMQARWKKFNSTMVRSTTKVLTIKRKKHAIHNEGLLSYSNKSDSFLSQNGVRLLETYPNPTWFLSGNGITGGWGEGYMVSHRGMGRDGYVGWECN